MKVIRVPIMAILVALALVGSVVTTLGLLHQQASAIIIVDTKEFNKPIQPNQSLTGGNLSSSPIIGTLIGNAIGDSANSEEDDKAELSQRPNQSDLLAIDENIDNATMGDEIRLPQLSNFDEPSIRK